VAALGRLRGRHPEVDAGGQDEVRHAAGGVSRGPREAPADEHPRRAAAGAAGSVCRPCRGRAPEGPHVDRGHRAERDGGTGAAISSLTIPRSTRY